MAADLAPIIKQLASQFEAEQREFRDQHRLLVAPDKIVALCQSLRDEHGFEMLVGLSAVDYWPQQAPRFHVVYHFLSLAKNLRLEVRVPLEGDSPTLDTVTGVYPVANWFERELWDMFGLKINDHPDPRRILMPEDWEGHPLRKDYPLDYEEVQFTFNFEEIDLRKPRPKD